MVGEIKTIEERKQSLLKKGKENGYVTYEELASELKGLEVDSDTLDDLYNLLVENNIEIVENKPLARMLYANVEVGQVIPPELYQAVAEVLAFVYRLKGKV